jgi:hypothetical protein
LEPEDGDTLKMNLTGVAELPHLSFFDTYAAGYDFVNAESAFINITGLKKMDDNGVFVDIFAGKYSGALYSYYRKLYNKLN